MEPKCPHLKITKAYDDQFDEVYEGYICTLYGKPCLHDTDEKCDDYNDWLYGGTNLTLHNNMT